jgi:hypothetical protein
MGFRMIGSFMRPCGQSQPGFCNQLYIRLYIRNAEDFGAYVASRQLRWICGIGGITAG